MPRDQRQKNVNSEDEESLFDFLEDDHSDDRTEPEDGPEKSGARSRHTSRRTKDSDPSLPVIRKPVCISQSGPLTPPKPGDPVEPPPRLTDPIHFADKSRPRQVAGSPHSSDIDDFAPDTSLDLDLGEDDWPSSENWVDSYDRPAQVRYDDSDGSGLRVLGYTLGVLLIAGGTSSALYSVAPVRQWADRVYANFTGGIETASQGKVLTQNNSEALAIPQGNETDTELAVAVDSQAPLAVPGSTIGGPQSLNAQFRETLERLERLMAQGSIDEAKTILNTMDRVVYGYGAPEFKQIEEQIAAQADGSQPVTDTELALADSQEASVAEQLRLQQEAALVEEQRIAEQIRQRELELEAAEAERAALEQAQREAALDADRQAALEAERQAALEPLRQAELEALRQAELEVELEAQRQAELEAQRQAELEAQRQAELEAQRQAELEAQRQAELEAQRLAALEAERQLALENQRAAELQAAIEEAARLEAEQARLAAQRNESEQLRADRIAQEKARLEQLEIARLQRQRSDQLQAPANAVNTTGSVPLPAEESVQDIAARQRAEARAQRIAQASEREVLDTEVLNAEILEREAAESERQTTLAQNQVPTTDEPANTVALAEPAEPVRQRITDADLQVVYGLFSQLQSAIETRDINEVLRLTETSGARIQQVMQMFENNVTVEAHLRNVSTLDSTGEIQGTLQITRLERVDGSVTGPPLNLGLVRLSSVRQGDGWSRIRW